MLIVLLSFSSSLATKSLSLNDEPCMVILTLIDLNPVELKYYPLMISSDNVVEVVMSYHQIYVLQKETKDINVKACNMTANKNQAKTKVKYNLCDYKCKFNNTTCNSNQT